MAGALSGSAAAETEQTAAPGATTSHQVPLHPSEHEPTSTDAPLAGFLCPPVGAGFGSCPTGRGLDILGSESRAPIPVLDQDGVDRPVAEQREELPAVAAQYRAHFAHHLVDGVAVLGAQATTLATWRSRSALWSADDTRAWTAARPGLAWVVASSSPTRMSLPIV
jgi:hypothetical protein